MFLELRKCKARSTSVSGSKYLLTLTLWWYQGKKVKNATQACLQEDLWPWTPPKTWVRSHFLKKNEQITNVFRIAEVQSTQQSGIRRLKGKFHIYKNKKMSWMNCNIFCGLFRFSHSDQLADGISHRRKFFFIFCHYISDRHNWIMVQVEGVCCNSPACFWNCLQRVIKEPFIVSFKF